MYLDYIFIYLFILFWHSRGVPPWDNGHSKTQETDSLAPPIISCVIWGKLINISVLQFPYLQYGNNDSTYLIKV